MLVNKHKEKENEKKKKIIIKKFLLRFMIDKYSFELKHFLFDWLLT